MIYLGPGFLAVYDLAPRSPPAPFLQLNRPATFKKRKNLLTKMGEEAGKEPNHTTHRVNRVQGFLSNRPNWLPKLPHL
jgi:hypothetical protein